MNGSIDIGYEINREVRYCIRLGQKNVIGAYNCTFNKKTVFTYKVSECMDAFTMRKQKWMSHLNDPQFKDLVQTLKNNVESNYYKCIKDRIFLLQ